MFNFFKRMEEENVVEKVDEEVVLDEQIVPDAITSPELVPPSIIGKVEEIGLVINHVALGNAGDTDKGLVIS